MSRHDGIDGSRKTGHGLCHRCGWKGAVAKTSRQERRALGVDASVRRLCSECLTDLARKRLGTSEQTARHTIRLKRGHHRDVA